jgi:Tfp pilus assembly protein PilE
MTKRREKNAGFTLIELLIIAPIVVIAISGFIALMISVVGKVLLTRDQATMSYETQNALNRIEEDVRLSAKFLTTSGTLPSPQGSNNNFTGTSAFTNTSNTLILNALATDSNPRASDRWLMYYDNQPNPCGDDETANRVFSIRVIYFINGNTLWRRTYVPSWNLNTDTPDANTICTYSSDYYPWQQNSCSPGYTSSQCQTEDERVMDNVSSLNVQYFGDPNSTTDLGAAGAESATTINVTVNGSKTTAGNAFTSSSSLRVTKLNSINTDASPLTAPVVSHSNPLPDQAQFSWPGIPSATNYLVSYNINGGTWTNTTLGSSTTSYTVDADRGDTVSFKVAATNGSFTSNYTTDADTLDLWTDISLQNSWANYAAGYNTAQFTKTSSGRVFLKGLVRYGANGSIIGQLPQGYRPAGRLVFQTNTSPNVSGRIDVDASGNIIAYSANTAWISLDSVSFLPSSSPYAWNELPFYNSWSNWSAGYETVHATKDNLGRVNLQGLAKAGTTTSNTTINQLSDINSTYYPPTSLHFPAGGSGFSEFWVWYTSGQVVKRGAQTSSYMGLQALFYPGTAGTWSTATLQNSWANYGGTYPTLQYTRDSDKVVTIRGLVKSGTATGGTVITNLPLGYRPPGQQLMTVASNDDIGRVDVTTSGNIIVQNVDNTWVALNFSYVVN